MANHGGVLVAESAGHGHAGQDAGGVAIDVARRTDAGQHGGGDVHGSEDVGIPGEGMQIHQHGTAGVGDIGDVDAAVDATGQVPN